MSEINLETEAFTRFPDLVERRFDGVDSFGMLWIELGLAFEDAYQEPRNEGLISRIYEFADWCIRQPEEVNGEHLPTIVCTHFYEHIPLLEPALLDMPRWFTRADVLEMKSVFSYHASEEGFLKILEIYDQH